MVAYERELKKILAGKCEDESLNVIIDTLFKIGVIDYSQCKALCIRKWCKEKVAEGMGIVDAMWEATEIFACSYEYARKCIYYYKDLGFD
ncbi:MAG: hypothetical protein R3Y38_05825 [Rikenellaceae bacterium]